VSSEERQDAGSQLRLAGTGGVQKRGTLLGWSGQGVLEQRFFSHGNPLSKDESGLYSMRRKSIASVSDQTERIIPSG
jgi:hypothetical protein